MTREKGKEIEEKTVETKEEGFKQVIVPPEPPQAEPKPPTAEEQMATLLQEKAELEKKFEQVDKGLRTAQATLTQKDRLLKEKEDVRGEIETLKNMVKILATRNLDEDADDFEGKAKKVTEDIDTKFKALEESEKARKYQSELGEQILSYKTRVEALGLTEEDESYWEIYNLVTNARPADFKIADIKLKKLEKAKENTPVDNKPTDGNKEVAELKKQIEKLQAIVSGKLDSETGLPAGSSADEKTIRENYRKKPNDPDARQAYYSLVGNKRR